MAEADKLLRLGVRMPFDDLGRPAGGVRGIGPVTKAVDDRNGEAPRRGSGDVAVTRHVLAGHRAHRDAPLRQWALAYRSHLIAVTTVPEPGDETI